MSQERWTIQYLTEGWKVTGSAEDAVLHAVEVVPARALEAALEEARRYKDALDAISLVEPKIPNSPLPGVLSTIVAEHKGMILKARSVLVSGGRDGE